MEISYDKDADALYIELQKGEFARNNKVDEFTIVDMDGEDKILGIELLSASKRIAKESLSTIRVKNIMITE